MDLPPAFVANIRLYFPEQGEQWLASLSQLLKDASLRWDLTLGEAFPLSVNYVCAVTRRDLSPAVLKIGVPQRELTSEINALRLYDGEGACRLYEADEDAGMMLIERLAPGTMLLEKGTDAQQTTIAARVMKHLLRPAPAEDALITLQGWFDGLKKLRPGFGGGTGPFPRRLVETVESLLPDLQADASRQVLLHGDCHHFNILLSGRGWLVIDPKGVIGAAEYEPAPFLINPWDEFIRRPNAAQVSLARLKIFAEVLELDIKRLHAWAICHSLLSAWWNTNQDGTGFEYSSACGEILLKVRV